MRRQAWDHRASELDIRAYTAERWKIEQAKPIFERNLEIFRLSATAHDMTLEQIGKQAGVGVGRVYQIWQRYRRFAIAGHLTAVGAWNLGIRARPVTPYRTEVEPLR